MHTDLDDVVQSVGQNFPYLALVSENGRAQLYVVAERIVLHKCPSVLRGLLSLVAVYFTLNIEYPKALYAPLLFLQHFVFNIKDQQPIPGVVVRLLSSLDQQ